MIFLTFFDKAALGSQNQRVKDKLIINCTPNSSCDRLEFYPHDTIKDREV